GGPGVIVVAADGSLKGKKDEGKRISFRRAASPLRSPSRLEDEDAWDGKTLKEEGVGRRSADSERREDPVVGTSVDSARKDEDQKGGVADHAVDIVTDVGLSPDDKDAIKPDAGVVAHFIDTDTPNTGTEFNTGNRNNGTIIVGLIPFPIAIRIFTACATSDSTSHTSFIVLVRIPV
ncbi:hypothetical protein HK101_005304, partial [Irineochytrium annulatum]